MVITKREDVTKTGKVSVKYSEENGSVLGEVSYQYLFNFFLCQRGKVGGGQGGSRGGLLFEFQWEGEGRGVGGGRLFEVGANSRLGAYSNKYGTLFQVIRVFYLLYCNVQSIQFLVCNHVTRRAMLGVNAVELFSKKLHQNRLKFSEERNAFALDHQHGRLPRLKSENQAK